ncbi:DUF7266 family protein [Halostella pelagica]|uniref:DUF7266 family protein n=1 Tax=Halostella pelagica TaxID=2583824 RepID=UPI0010810BDE|nr:hypothetical protein [Halostella pelagica]
MADRAMTPVVGKALEATIVVLYIGLLTTTLYGGAIPEYQTAAAEEVGDRTLSRASHGVQQAVPVSGAVQEARIRVDLPDRIRGEPYRIRADGESLVLDHPHPDVGGRSRLSLPDSVVAVSGTWRSGAATVVVLERVDNGVSLRLEDGT